MEFSGEQKNIINAKLANNLVSASAGSGKTTVLTARIGEEIVSGALSVDSMLVVTFTEDAASHMADKIEQKLKELRNDAIASGNIELAQRLSSQIDLLPNAYIQTMHGFCSRVIKEKGYLLGDSRMADFTDPSCRIVSESEQKVLLRSAAEQALRVCYSECTTDSDPFVRFTRRFGNGRTDDSLIPFVTDTYEVLRSLPNYLDKCRDFVKERKERDLKGQIMFFGKEKEIPLRIAGYLTRIKDTIESSDFASVLANHNKYRIVEEYTNDEFISLASTRIGQVCEAAKTKEGFDFFDCLKPLMELGELKFKNMFTKADLRGDDRAIMAVVGLRHFVDPTAWSQSKYKNQYDLPQEYSELMTYKKDEVLANQKAGTEAVECFEKMLEKTDEIYLKLKNTINGMDFSDLEHTALEILSKEDASTFYRGKFTEIFVDEYQDNTELQDTIIRSFENTDEGNVFRVGDVKQSIYKFRFAAPDIFLKRMDDYNNYREKGKVYYLKENHRSTCEILAFANYVFEQTMSKAASEIEYGADQRLSRASETRHGPVPRVIVANKSVGDDDGVRKNFAETRAILATVENEVRDYLENGSRIDGSKPEFRDICILTSSNGQAEAIARYLNGCTLNDGRKIEASGRFTTDVFEDMDIHRLINFLICLGNEYRDDYVAGVMFSNYKFSNFTIEELAEIQAFIHEVDDMPLSLDSEPLMLRLRLYSKRCDSVLASRVAHFIDVFDRIRMRSMVADIDDTIELIYRETSIKATLEARKADSTKLDIFKDWLSENFKRRGADISGISSELEQMKIMIKAPTIEVKDSSTNKITTMTIHKSKGLEYPFVILVANGGNDEKKDNLKKIMFDRKDGFITEDFDTDTVTKSKSFEQKLYSMNMDLATNAETLRLLYVALTRAEERLSIVTTCNVEDVTSASPMRNAFTQAIGYDRPVFDERHWLAGNMKLPYCLMSALARSRDGELLRELAGCGDLPPLNVIEFHDIDGNKTVGGFEAVDMTAGRITELYEASKPSQDDGEDEECGDDGKPVEFDGEGRLILPEYQYSNSVDIPFKVSVTGISKDGIHSESVHVDMQIRSIDDFESASVSVPTAAAKGTILHRIMRFIDLEGVRDGSLSVTDEVKSLIDEGYLSICSPSTGLEVAEEFESGIEAFCKSPVCEDIIKSFGEGTARSEKPIVFSVFIDGEDGDSALVQGMIDLIYKTSEGYTILDYKTDRLDGSSPEERAKEALERHAFQLNSYAAACEKDGINVVHKLLYLVRYGEFVEV